MHCYDQDFTVFCLLPPFNVVNSQVIQKQLNKPIVLDSSAAKVTYQGVYSDRYVYDTNGKLILVDHNSINTTSVSKTNFWNFVSPLFKIWFGYFNLPSDVGLLGFQMPGLANIPQPFAFDTQPPDPKLNWFAATGIPITNIDDNGNTNCFSLMDISAKNMADNVLSSLKTVLPASSEMNCASCHETADQANGTTTFSDASPPPRLPNPPTFSEDGNAIIRVRENILILHDALGNFSEPGSYPGYIAAAYPGYDSLWKVYKSGTPVLCAGCHYSKALDLNNVGPNAAQKGHLYLSRAMHKHHGTAWPTGTGGMGGSMAGGGYTVPIPGTGAQQCYYCHPGNDTQCLRSVMAIKGMQCQSCHGGLLAVAGFTSQLALPHGVDRLPTDPALLAVTLTTGPDKGQQRQPWVDMPKCQSCHTGDALNHLGPQIVGTQAYTNPNNETASPIMAPNSPFAENNGLYRFSQTHGGVACEACHNSTHAEWPARTDSNDNKTPIQIQGYAAEITECGSCHTGDLNDPNKALGGPHGLHSVNFMSGTSSTWPGAAHGTAYNQDPAKCEACHGRDLKGTVLSRAKAERILAMSKSLGGGYYTFNAGDPVNCYSCHKMIVH